MRNSIFLVRYSIGGDSRADYAQSQHGNTDAKVYVPILIAVIGKLRLGKFDGKELGVSRGYACLVGYLGDIVGTLLLCLRWGFGTSYARYQH
jgi:hypothetical protein